MSITPVNIALDCIERARALMPSSMASPRKQDLARLSLVMGVAALDAMMHAIVLRRVSTVRNDLPTALKNLDISFDELALLAESAVDAQQTDKKGRPWVQVKNALQRRILTITFQTHDQVSKALSLAGVKKPWDQIASGMGEPSKDIRIRLNAIVHRRNQIVHEGDHRRLARPQTVSHNDVNLPNIQADLDWLEKLVHEVAKVAT